MKRIQKIITIFLIIILFLGNISYADSIKVKLDGSVLELSVNPISVDGRTLVPLRAIFESLGAEVHWDQSTKTITGVQNDKIIKLQVDNKVATINGVEIKLDVAATVISGSTFVPVRFIAESLGAQVGWDNNTKTVIINSKIYNVIRVVDGDTFKINYNGVEESVRLIGIDTPESVHPEVLKNMPEGKAASEYTKSKLEGKDIAIEFDVQERDMYGRLLAYVWLNGEMFNKTLLQEGYAQVATYPPNIKYVEDFTAIQKIARENKKGFWANEGFAVEDIIEEVVKQENQITNLEVNAGEMATLKLKLTPNQKYSIAVYYKSGKSKAKGLEDKISDSEGNIFWTWEVGGKTTPGTYEIQVKGDKEYKFNLIVK